MRLLGITAHPDDEVGAFGGALLLYHSRGVETYVICLTRGTAASNRGGARSNEELAALRSAEFRESCAILKVTEAQILDYPDGGLDRADCMAVVGDLTRQIRRIRPHLVLTMGPEGGLTGHIDHAMASLFATMAYHWAARQDRFPEQLIDGVRPHAAQKLYYHTAALVLPDRPPVAPPPWSAAIDVAPYIEDKIRATQAHATQSPLMERFAKTIRKFGGTELFHLAASTGPKGIQQETDLLAGISA
jgi:LmbE family N-acetylglucosaminyl deacetylase